MEFSWGAVNRPKDGQLVSGDTYVVETDAAQYLLVSVIDGLGGGEEARRAAHAAADVLREHPNSDPEELVRRAHRALHQTRGAVLALLQFDLQRRQASFVGVGNVGVNVYAQEPIKPISKNGIIGYRLPQLLRLSYHYNSGDTFVLYSDGVSGRFALDAAFDHRQTPQTLAEQILHTYGKTNDDATVLVVRLHPQVHA
jgi:negative regulator of sigma-B (phosphoserine phosphatase)